MKKLIALDVGSSAIKACVFGFEKEPIMLYSNTTNINLYSPKPGYAEHDAQEVFESVTKAIKNIFDNYDVKKEEIECVSICSQAQCVLLVDKNGKAITPIYNSQDARAFDTFKKYYSNGINVDGINVFKAAQCVLSSGFLPGSAKDPVFKFKWVEDNHPEIYKDAYKWLDIKDYIIFRLTGEIVTTKDNAHAYTVYNSRKNNGSWGDGSCKAFKVDKEKLPNVVDSFDIVGTINEELSEKTGLAIGTPILGGIIDSSGVQYGSGASDVGETMIYWGTSGWVGTVTDKLLLNFFAKTGSLITAEDEKYHYYAVLDSTGVSYSWLKEHIIGDDDVLHSTNKLSEKEIYLDMNSALDKIDPGSNGLIYTPWLTGVRAPMEASDIGAMFLNVRRNMGKKHFAKAVIEGICYHFRLLMEATKNDVKIPSTIRFVGGGAKSDQISQILADVTGCRVEVPSNPQDAGAYGAALVGFYALDKDNKSFSEMTHLRSAEKVFEPNLINKEIYNKYYKVYKQIYDKNHKILSNLAAINESLGD